MKIENSCQIYKTKHTKRKYTKRSSWRRITLNWTPEGKGPMNSVFSVRPFVSSIFFSESALRIFLIFCINLGDNMALKVTLTFS